MNGIKFLSIIKYKYKNKLSNGEVLSMDEIEKIIREIMAERDCGPLYALYILSKMLEVA